MLAPIWPTEQAEVMLRLTFCPVRDASNPLWGTAPPNGHLELVVVASVADLVFRLGEEYILQITARPVLP